MSLTVGRILEATAIVSIPAIVCTFNMRSVVAAHRCVLCDLQDRDRGLPAVILVIDLGLMGCLSVGLALINCIS